MVPVSVHDRLIIRIEDLIGTSIRVLDRNEEARGASLAEQSEVLIVWRGARVLDVVEVPSLVDEGREARPSLLASVEAIPAVIHVRVQLVVEAVVEILDVDWLEEVAFLSI